MPIYTFQCRDCGHEVDEITSSSTKVIECSHCEKLTAERMPPMMAQARGFFGTAHKKPGGSKVPLKFKEKKDASK